VAWVGDVYIPTRARGGKFDLDIVEIDRRKDDAFPGVRIFVKDIEEVML
jgi:hypothetical protein